MPRWPRKRKWEKSELIVYWTNSRPFFILSLHLPFWGNRHDDRSTKIGFIGDIHWYLRKVEVVKQVRKTILAQYKSFLDERCVCNTAYEITWWWKNKLVLWNARCSFYVLPLLVTCGTVVESNGCPEAWVIVEYCLGTYSNLLYFWIFVLIIDWYVMLHCNLKNSWYVTVRSQNLLFKELVG